jgi:DNA-binding beta-propeller fold protein YncE
MRMRKKLAVILPIGALTAAIAGPVAARSISKEFRGFSGVSFALEGRPIGVTKAAKTTAPYLAGTRIALVGDGALVIDADSGQLIRTDKDGKNVAAIAIGKNAGLMAYDPVGKLAYVADRSGNRVAVVKVGEQLEVSASYKTPVEPYGVALSPDRKSLLVTTIADRALVAFEAASGKEQWRTALGREPRNIAVSPDGKRAIVAYLTTGTVDQVDLVETKQAEHIALSTQSNLRRFRGGANAEAFARGAFTALFMGEQQAIVPFQRETPIQQIGSGERTGSYGGGFDAPIHSQLAFLATNGESTSQVTAQMGQHQARALAWDAERDALYVVGLGSDSLLQLKNASQVTITEGYTAALPQTSGRCGPDGVAIAPDGDVFVWCAFSRTVQRIDTVDDKGKLATSIAPAKIVNGPELVASSFDEKQHQGMVLFHASSTQVSQGGALACSSCHPDGRADGLSWRIDKHELQTPVLVGRVAGTHPYKWDGGDPDIKASLTGTMKRLGGSGLKPEQTAALAAYLEALPAPQTPSRDTQMVARGQKLFDSAELGCRTCHDGAKYTDNTKHEFKAATLKQADTPSLVGLAAGAPYYHDGSAATLESLLRDRAKVHGMAETAKLTDAQVAELIAFLETL